jgi:hypothetical protein
MMTATCSNCGGLLVQFKLFSQVCPACGVSHKARGGASVAGGIYGASFPFLMIGGFFLPGPLWIPLLVVPLVLIAGGIFGSLAAQKWVRE